MHPHRRHTEMTSTSAMQPPSQIEFSERCYFKVLSVPPRALSALPAQPRALGEAAQELGTGKSDRFHISNVKKLLWTR